MPVDDKTEEIPFLPSTIETIDIGLFNWVDETLSLSVNTNNGFKKVPVLWLSAERSFQIKNNKDLRDASGKLKLPLITLTRKSMTKDPTFRGSHYANIFPNDGYRGGSTPIARRIMQVKTRNQANSQAVKKLRSGDETGRIDNKKVVYETMSLPVPVYVEIMYTVTMRTEYIQQINTLATPFITVTGGINSFIFENDGHKYEAFIQPGFTPMSNASNLGEEERFFETQVEIKVLGYLIGAGPNNERPKAIIRENIVEVKVTRERVMVGQKIPWAKVGQKYRE